MSSKVQYLILFSVLFFVSCHLDNESLNNDKDENQLNDQRRYLLPDKANNDTFNIQEDLVLSYEEVKSYLKENEYIDKSSIAYTSFLKLFGCEDSDSIIYYTNDPKLKLFAYYRLVDEECLFSTEDAIKAIQSFKDNHHDTLIGVWTHAKLKEKLYLHQIAANRIWERYDFRMTKKQKKLVKELRGIGIPSFQYP